MASTGLPAAAGGRGKAGVEFGPRQGGAVRGGGACARTRKDGARAERADALGQEGMLGGAEAGDTDADGGGAAEQRRPARAEAAE